MTRSATMYTTLVATVALSRAERPPTRSVERSGAPTVVSGTGVVQLGEQPGNLVLVPDSGDERYCLTGEEKTHVAEGDRVSFVGKRYAALALKGEQCLRLELTRLEKR